MVHQLESERITCCSIGILGVFDDGSRTARHCVVCCRALVGARLTALDCLDSTFKATQIAKLAIWDERHLWQDSRKGQGKERVEGELRRCALQTRPHDEIWRF